MLPRKTKKAPAPSVPFHLTGAATNIATTPPPDMLYYSCAAKDATQAINRHIFIADQWLTWFRRYKHPRYKQAMRCLIQSGTIDACLRTRYVIESGELVKFPRKDVEYASKHSVMYPSDYKFGPGSLEDKAGKGSKEERASAEEKHKQQLEDRKKERKSRSSRSSQPDMDDKKEAVAPKTSPRGGVPSQEPIHAYKCEMTVVNGDCLEAARWLQASKEVNVCVLNMASSSRPGGGYRTGAGAQEESLHRCTNLFHCLDNPYEIPAVPIPLDPHHARTALQNVSYPIPEFGAIYSPGVLVVRRAEAYGYRFLPQPCKVAVVSASAYSNPPLEVREASGSSTGEEVFLSHKIALMTKRKMLTVLHVAIENGHDAIVLSAFGCGVYGNPASHIAQLWRDALDTPWGTSATGAPLRVQDRFRHAVFAIIDQRSDVNPKGSLGSFEQVMKVQAVKIGTLLGEPEEGTEEGDEDEKGEDSDHTGAGEYEGDEQEEDEDDPGEEDDEQEDDDEESARVDTPSSPSIHA